MRKNIKADMLVLNKKVRETPIRLNQAYVKMRLCGDYRCIPEPTYRSYPS